MERELKLDENEYAIYGRLKKGVTGVEIIQVEFKLMDEEDEEEDEGWTLQEFTVPANDSSFEISLKELRGIQGGLEYDLRMRYFQRWDLDQKTSYIVANILYFSQH